MLCSYRAKADRSFFVIEATIRTNFLLRCSAFGRAFIAPVARKAALPFREPQRVLRLLLHAERALFDMDASYGNVQVLPIYIGRNCVEVHQVVGQHRHVG